MKVLIIIPAHNEEKFIDGCLLSLTNQTKQADKILIVNDNSTDDTESIIDQYTAKYSYIQKLNTTSGQEHLPGSKVVQAFNKGLATVNTDTYDVICKFDADLIFPNNYIEAICNGFATNHKTGLVSGYIYEENNNGNWVLNHPMNMKHVRGALKAYSNECFNKIGGLKDSMGWDTVDELLTKYHGYQLHMLPELHVKHLRPTGKSYNKKAKKMQGEAMYKMRYGFTLTAIASAKMALKQKKIKTFFHNLQGYLACKQKKVPYIVTEQEGTFIRKYRFSGIFSKLGIKQ